MSNEVGRYVFTAPRAVPLELRILASSVQGEEAEGARYDVQILDNLNGRSLWGISAALELEAEGALPSFDLVAAHEDRSAGPFSILDVVHQSMEKVWSVDPEADFPPLRLNWSPMNRSSCREAAPYPEGCVGTSFYRRFDDGVSNIVLLGDLETDADDYDTHVIAHEWGHYFENELARSDSLGGSHNQSAALDLRVAFGEGFGNAWAAIVLDNPIYRDANGPQGSGGFTIDVEGAEIERPGWFSEATVQQLIYDLYDPVNEGEGDPFSFGLAPIYQALTGSARESAAMSSIFTFLSSFAELRRDAREAISVFAAARGVNSIRAFAEGEVNDGGLAEVLPVYQWLRVGAAPRRFCSTPTYGRYNRLGNRALFRFALAESTRVQLSVEDERLQEAEENVEIDSDPDIYLYRRGEQLRSARGAEPGRERLEEALDPGLYTVEAYDYRVVQRSGEARCFTLSISHGEGEKPSAPLSMRHRRLSSGQLVLSFEAERRLEFELSLRSPAAPSYRFIAPPPRRLEAGERWQMTLELPAALWRADTHHLALAVHARVRLLDVTSAPLQTNAQGKSWGIEGENKPLRQRPSLTLDRRRGQRLHLITRPLAR